MTKSLITPRGLVTMSNATLSELYSALAHSWSEVYSSMTPRNEFGQRLRVPRTSRSEENQYRSRLIESRGIPQIEAELSMRGADPKAKSFVRVAASYSQVYRA